jgi:excisionase family DNA binding protein
MQDILDAREAAQYLRINEQTIRSMARDGRIPAFKLGNTWRFKKSVLDEWASNWKPESSASHDVIIIDDEPLVRDFLSTAIESANMKVRTAASGAEGIQMMHDKPADLVFLDLSMPEMNGPTVLGKIRETWKEIPVVIVTAYPESDLMEQALQHSPIMLLAKPFVISQLENCIKTIFGE